MIRLGEIFNPEQKKLRLGQELLALLSWDNKEKIDEQKCLSLIAEGASLVVKDKCDRTALHYAAHRGLRDLSEKMIDAGADIAAKAPHCGNVIAMAAGSGHADTLHMLLRRGVPLENPNGSDNNPLYSAIYYHRGAEIVKILIDHGADANACKSSPLLNLAIRRNYLEIADLLIKAGADVTYRWGHYDRNKTPLDIAREEGSAEMIRLIETASGIKDTMETAPIPAIRKTAFRPHRAKNT